MTESRIEEVLFEVNGKLAAINGKLDSLSETILKHEARISKVEDELHKHLVETVPVKSQEDFKTEMLKLLGKAILVAIITIGTLTGSAEMIAGIFGK